MNAASDPPPPLARLLTLGGDVRLALDPETGLNRYGCAPHPARPLPAFASCTASPVSARGFAAAQAAYRLTAGAAPGVQAAAFDRLRAELAVHLGVEALAGCGLILTASGTDAHLLAAQWPLEGGRDAPLRVVLAENDETGNGVPQALTGRHYNARAPLAGGVVPGAALEGCRAAVLDSVPLRDGAGRPRPGAAVDAEFGALVEQAAGRGGDALLVVTDVSKTGLLAPSPDLALELMGRFGPRVRVLVDACQLRLTPGTLRTYLERGFFVALTGSKFMGGPAFSGALLTPPRALGALRDFPLPRGLAAYGAKADWPQGWSARTSLAHEANLGLLLRWEAALAEFKAFRELDPEAVDGFFARFMDAARKRLDQGEDFGREEAPGPRRGTFAPEGGWQARTTLMPFTLGRGSAALPLERCRGIHRALALERGLLGQPARLRRGPAGSAGALRLALSAANAVDALAPGGRGERAVTAEALDLLEAAAGLARA